MNLSNANALYVYRVLKIADVLKIPAISFQTGLIKGMSDSYPLFILQTKDVPNFESNIGINKIPVFMNRMDLVSSQPNFSVECSTVDNTDQPFVRSVLFKTNTTKVGFTCTSPKSIKGPIQVNDPLKVELTISSDLIDIVNRGIKAMAAKKVSLMNNDKEAFVEVVDINGDIFKFNIPASSLTFEPNVEKTFAFTYPADTFLSLIKNSSNSLIKLGNKGTFNTEIDNINVFMLPKV